jgi:tRNA pseudouridine55 synthase
MTLTRKEEIITDALSLLSSTSSSSESPLAEEQKQVFEKKSTNEAVTSLFNPMSNKQGILIVDKVAGKTSFSLVAILRKLTNISKIGHAGTLDPFATGVMVMLIGAPFTRLSEELMKHDKEYITTVQLGQTTSTYDCDGEITSESDLIPTFDEVEKALESFQGKILQTPPMFSAKKIKGQKLYHLARRGVEVERPAVPVELWTQLLSYEYPYLRLKVRCSKGTYIRSLAHDLGQILRTGAHLCKLQRTRSGPFTLENAISQELLQDVVDGKSASPFHERSLESFIYKSIPQSCKP